MPEASFDNWTVIFLLAAAQGIFLGLVLIFREKKNPAFLLGTIVFLFSITLIEYVAFWTNYRFEYPHVNRVSIAFPFLFGPLFYLYVKAFAGKSNPKKEGLVHAIPFLVFLAYQIPYYILSGEEKLGLLTNEIATVISDPFLIHLLTAVSLIVPLMMISHMSLYFWKSYKLISDVGFDKIEEDAKRWMDILLTCYSGFILSFAAYYVMVYVFEYILIIDYVLSIIMSLLIYGLGYICLIKPKLVYSTMSDFRVKDKYSNSGLDESYSGKIKERLLQKMDAQKLYLRGDLKLEDLAEEIGESKHHISQVLNDELGTTFSNFVNEYRIDLAKKLLKNDSQNLNMYGIAKESGFNNKTTFNLAFKRHTGYTPTQFKNSTA